MCSDGFINIIINWVWKLKRGLVKLAKHTFSDWKGILSNHIVITADNYLYRPTHYYKEYYIFFINKKGNLIKKSFLS